MTINDLADHIVKHFGKVPYHYGDDFTVSYHTRSVLKEHMHITEQQYWNVVKELPTMTNTLSSVDPLAKTDTEAWHRECNKPPGKGRTRRHFR